MSFSYLRGEPKIVQPNDTAYLAKKMVSRGANYVSRRANLFLLTEVAGYGE